MYRKPLTPLIAVIVLCALTATVQADLVGWWAFDEDVEDQSEKENHGLLDFPIFEDDVPDAIGDGMSLSFDGNVGVEIAADPSLDSDAFTLSMFVLNRGQAAQFSRLTSRQSDTFETSLGTGRRPRRSGSRGVRRAPGSGPSESVRVLPLAGAAK